MDRSSKIADLNDQCQALETKFNQAADGHDALGIATKAAELAFKALQLSSSRDQKAVIRKKLEFFLAEAEQIKANHQWRPKADKIPKTHSRSPLLKLREPVSMRQLPQAEVRILFGASELNTFRFPPWDGPPNSWEMAKSYDGRPYLESPDLPLSSMQRDVFKGWRRPNVALLPLAERGNTAERTQPSMEVDGETDLVQDAVTDCSVVASLCADSARTSRGQEKIIPSALWPQDSSGKPQLCEQGKYLARLNFNGCFRRVIVDDRLPISNVRMLHVSDRRQPNLLWPAIIEKAYLKVHGGYDFPGSNSGTDLWMLTGWIPEQVFLQSEDASAERLWAQILKPFAQGHVMITMGTGTMSNQTERITGLAGDHDYAVLDIREVNGKRLLLVKNPWCDGTSWKGAVAAHPQPGEEADGDSHTAPDDDTLVDLELSSRYLTESNFVQYDQNPTEGRSIDQANADKLRPGIFWIDLGNVFQHFESIYLNWHPGLFNWRENIHFEWDLSKYTTHYLRNQGNLCDNPQLRVSCAQGGIVWLLLDRHIRDRKIQSDTDRRKTTSESLSEEFISLYAFKSGGKRVYISDGNTHQGPFVDAPQTLLPMEFEPETPYTIVPLEQGLSAEIRTFTLSVFSHNPVAISWASDPHAIHKIEAGAWTAISAGGNTHSKDYLRNPQYTLTVDRKTSIALILMSPMKELNLNVKLMHCGRIPARIKNMARRDIIVDSGDYRPSCALACFSELDAGTYAIICSTFEAKQLGMFTLRVDTNAQTTLRKLPPADAGQLHKKLADASFRQGTERIAAPIAPERLIRATFTVQHIAAFTKPMKVPSKDGQGFEYTPQRLQTHSLVQISVELGRGPQKRILVASSGGQHADASQGVRTEDVDLSPELLNQDKLWLVIDRMSAPYDAAEEWFKVEMSCDVPDALVVGVWRTWGD